ncbi:MAG: DUF3109 family protein [Candidatus Omnitrophica bacterium]|nr:DUF3109 family protein [Candidatus Omnitrophota bacterium]
MVLIEKVLVSSEILESHFSCNIFECRGMCCCEGQGGAPLESDEIEFLEKIIPEVSRYMRESSIKSIRNKGPWVRNIFGGIETPLAEDGWCVYAVETNGVVRCSIEIAWQKKEIDFRKPISCHLYPVRIRKFGFFEVLIYEHWDICRCNSDEGSPFLYEFVSEALKRKYGDDFLDKLDALSRNSKRHRC